MSSYSFISSLQLHKKVMKMEVKSLRRTVDKRYKVFAKAKIPLLRRPPQVKSSKSQIHAKYHRIPTIRFENQQLTSFSGLLIFQLLFKHLNLKQKLKRCFSHSKVFSIFGHHLVVMLPIVHLLLGFRRLREVDNYRDDPPVLRLMGLRKIPDVSTKIIAWAGTQTP